MRSFVVLGLLAALGIGAWYLTRGKAPGSPLPPPEVIEEPSPPPRQRFVGSETCKGCHEDRYETWQVTAHAYSLREASEQTVLGDFDGRTFTSRYFDATPYRRDGTYRIKVKGKLGRAPGDYRVTRVVGRLVQQAYLYTDNRGAWRVLPISWSIPGKRWASTHDVLAAIAGVAGDFPDDYDTRLKVFNDGCGQCHATGYDVGHDLETDTYESTFVEGAVACESCHGPGALHTAWHERHEDGALVEGYAGRGRLVHPRDDLDAKQVLESCGRCHYLHAWRYAIDDDPRVGFHESAISGNKDGAGFYVDGRISGLNYHGTTQVQSACFLQGGMSCLDCHKMHSGKPFALKWEEGDNAQCTQCHEEADYETGTHTHHAEAAGVRCVDCHMPRYVKAPLDYLRDHMISIPEPELTERFGRRNAPNACNLCHADATVNAAGNAAGDAAGDAAGNAAGDAAWAREWREKWWGPAPRRLVEDADVVARLRENPAKVDSGALAAMAARGESRHFFRMTALDRLAGRSDDVARAAVRDALGDPDPELVMIACLALGRFPDPRAIPKLLELLEHPVRVVRVEAAYALARSGWRGEQPGLWKVYEDAAAMLVRRRQSEQELTRVAMIADIGGGEEYFDAAFRALDKARERWSPVQVDLLHRYARRLTEGKQDDRALRLYAKVRELSGGRLFGFLLIDSADSLVGVGRVAEARGNWQLAMRQLEPDDPLRLLAKARLDPDRGRQSLEALAQRLATDLAAGESLRRVRFALEQMR